MIRALLPVLITIVILLALFLFFRSFRPGAEKRKFRSARFDHVRKEIDHGALHRDPVSGTYVPESDAIVVEIGGKKYYFSSRENAEQFRRDGHTD